MDHFSQTDAPIFRFFGLDVLSVDVEILWRCSNESNILQCFDKIMKPIGNTQGDDLEMEDLFISLNNKRIQQDSAEFLQWTMKS